MIDLLKEYTLLLASKSPRRQQLISKLGFDVEVISIDADEVIDGDVLSSDIPALLAKRKSLAYPLTIDNNQILVTADTLVVLDGKVLGKPLSRQDAYSILSSLSGKRHQVHTGVCLRTEWGSRVFTESTDVYFKNISDDEINYYLDNYEYMDKAGSYGIQEWIGMVAVERIEGDFYNVMGLPVARIYKEIVDFIKYK
ncbi:MAG: septum formation protein Maf [Bacteroidales bacterium]|nr:septum formation protein Maf [Bacteroidales bacterium]